MITKPKSQMNFDDVGSETMTPNQPPLSGKNDSTHKFADGKS